MMAIKGSVKYFDVRCRGGLDTIRHKRQSWHFSRHLRRTYKARSGSVAVGYTLGRKGVGGLRNHLLAIKSHSRYPVTLFPEEETVQLANNYGFEHQVKQWHSGLDLSNYAVVHSHVDPKFIRSCARARARGRFWIHTYHTLYFEADWGGSLVPWQQEINRTLIAEACQADVRISISPWLQQVLRDKYGIDSVVIPNGVRVAQCKQARPERFTERCGLAAGFILFVGSIASVKNPTMFIELAASMPGHTFVMIGKKLYAESLTELWGKPLPLNLFPIGPLPHADTLDAIAAASVFVMPSHSEGLPTALMEAMALGKPAVATDAFGCRDVIGDARYGILFPPNNFDALRVGVRSALENPEIGRYAAERIRAVFDWDVIILQIDALYESGF